MRPSEMPWAPWGTISRQLTSERAERPWQWHLVGRTHVQVGVGVVDVIAVAVAVVAVLYVLALRLGALAQGCGRFFPMSQRWEGCGYKKTTKKLHFLESLGQDRLDDTLPDVTTLPVVEMSAWEKRLPCAETPFFAVHSLLLLRLHGDVLAMLVLSKNFTRRTHVGDINTNNPVSRSRPPRGGDDIRS